MPKISRYIGGFAIITPQWFYNIFQGPRDDMCIINLHVEAEKKTRGGVRIRLQHGRDQPRTRVLQPDVVNVVIYGLL